MKIYELYADGACRPNPGTGGWAFLLRTPNRDYPDFGSEINTTNNRMELQATLEGLRCFYNEFWTGKEKIRLILDSKYVLEGISSWSPNWIKQGWVKKNGKPVMNADLWKELISLSDKLNLEFEHVKGHTGHKENELCDRLAVAAIKERKKDE